MQIVGESSGDAYYTDVFNTYISDKTDFYNPEIPNFPLSGTGGFTKTVREWVPGTNPEDPSYAYDYAWYFRCYGAAGASHPGHDVYFEITNAKCDDIPLYFE